MVGDFAPLLHEYGVLGRLVQSSPLVQPPHVTGLSGSYGDAFERARGNSATPKGFSPAHVGSSPAHDGGSSHSIASMWTARAAWGHATTATGHLSL